MEGLRCEPAGKDGRDLLCLIIPDPGHFAIRSHLYLKWENLQKTGSFKLRGAVHKMLSVEREKLSKGVITASAGNHAQGVAYGAGLLGIPATAVMPVSTPRVKVENTERLGARVILFGENYDEAYAHCMELTGRTGMTYIVLNGARVRMDDLAMLKKVSYDGRLESIND